jgi:CubicO group peptidase (beta-lactamase class C family)
MRLKAALVAIVAAAGLCWPLASQRPASLAPLPKAATETVDEAAPEPKVPTSPQLEAADLEAWLDGYVPASLERGKIAGAVVSVVKDGRVLVKKGYGYADVATKKPMDADRTLIRSGSTGKLFTWTAVMQLAEQGKLDLNRDINAYLDFKIPQPFGRPITLNHLMTHRGGFEEGLKDILAVDPARLPSTEAYLKEHQRPLMFPPGDVPAYSNYGTALAGYIVERVSGEPYDAYVERHVMQPLGMRRSTFRQPLPAGWMPYVSKGYRASTGEPGPYELITTRPAGSGTTTAADMANFMIAHLQLGRFGDRQILRPETARLMQTPSMRTRPGFATMAHGFFHGQNNGRVVIGHGGDTVLFHTDLNLLPQEGVGIFVNFNSRGEGDAVYGARQDLFDAFMDRYFPAPLASDPAALTTARAHANEIAGAYESSRRVESGFIAVFYLLQQQTIAPNEDGTISLASEPEEKFREVAPYVWRAVGGDRQLALIQVNGRKTVVDSEDPTSVLQGVSFARSSQLNVLVLFGSLIVLLWTLIAWPVGAAMRRLYGQKQSLTGRSGLVHRLTKFAVLADLAYLTAWFLMLQPILESRLQFYAAALDPWVRALQVAMIVPILAFLIGLWNAWLAVKEKRGWRPITGSILVALAALGVIWIAYMGSLMSWNLNY